MPNRTALWLEVVGGIEPDAGATLTRLDEVAGRVITPALARHGGVAVSDSPNSAHLEFPSIDSSLQALDDIFRQGTTAGLGFRAALGEDLTDRRDAAQLIAITDSGQAALVDGDTAIALPWHAEPAGSRRLATGAGPVAVRLLDHGHVAPEGGGKVRSRWVRSLVALPLGGIGFAAASAGLRRERTAPAAVAEPDADPVGADDPTIAEPETVDPIFEVPPPLDSDEYVPPRIATATPEQRELATEALQRFEDLGLELPSGLVIYFHDPGDYDACGGHVGLASWGEETRVDMCTEAPFTMQHELAHMWTEENLSDEEQAEFLEIRDLEGWRGPEEPRDDGQAHPHSEQGIEHAADIIAWGLLDGEIRPKAIYDNDDASLAEAFEQLTGSQPPHFQQPDTPVAGGADPAPGVFESATLGTQFAPDTGIGFGDHLDAAPIEDSLWSDDPDDLDDGLAEPIVDFNDDEAPLDSF